MNYCCVNLQVTSHCLENAGKWLYKDERVQKRVSLKVTQFSSVCSTQESPFVLHLSQMFPLMFPLKQLSCLSV